MTIHPQIWFKTRLIMGTLLLALGWLSVPISLAFQESDICEMECCVAEGHCCCAARRAYVKGHEPKPGDLAFNVESGFSTPCPGRCASPTTIGQHQLAKAIKSSLLFLEPKFTPPPYQRTVLQIPQCFAAGPSSPRAPPAYIEIS